MRSVAVPNLGDGEALIAMAAAAEKKFTSPASGYEGHGFVEEPSRFARTSERRRPSGWFREEGCILREAKKRQEGKMAGTT